MDPRHKICTKCGLTKSFEEFSWRNTQKGTKSPWCKDCHNLYENTKYKNSPLERNRKQRNKERNLQKNRIFAMGYLKSHPCVDCGIVDTRVLEFDHRDRGTKTECISQLIHNNVSLYRVEEEIAKCDVRCANCHRIRSGEQLGWWSHDPEGGYG